MANRMTLATLTLLLASGVALGDEIHLKNGHTLTGTVTESGDTLIYERPGLRMEIARDEVSSIVKAPTPADTLAKKRAALDANAATGKGAARKNAEGYFRLALWARGRKLRKESTALLKEALLLDSDHAAARQALGFVKWEGKWRVEADLMKERGFVRVGREWVAKEEVDRRQIAGDAKRREGASGRGKTRDPRMVDRERRKRLNAGLRALAHKDPEVRKKGEAAIVKLAKEMGDPDLEARAPEIRRYYGRLHTEIASARALVEVRTQWVTLKRPIKTFSTSLGAFSSPVRIQLPEVSVVRLNTTAVVPVQVVIPDLDDWLDE